MVVIDLNYRPGDAPIGEVDVDSDYESLNGDDLEDLAGGIENLAREEVENEDLAGDGFQSIIPELAVGQEFEASTEFEAFFHNYAYAHGFGARILSRDNPNKPRNAATRKSQPEREDYTRVRMVCKLQGEHKPIGMDPGKQPKSCRCNCPMGAAAYKQIDGSWRVAIVNLKHNHALNTESVRFLSRYRGISVADESDMLLQQRAGLRASQIYSVFIRKYDGIEKVPFSERDMRNLLSQNSRLQMEDGDFRAMQRLFDRMKANSPSFFYAHDIDDLGRVKNIFWADARGIKAYAEFGDTISFDTTYLSNRYNMPFAPIIGVNNHGQSTLFGCALIAKDDAENFTWLFKVFLKCMGNKAPKCILTDQCRAIGKVVADVFPNTRHRWCLWHVLRNMRKYFGTMTEWAEIAKSLRRILHESLSVEEFEFEWIAWAEKYKILGKEWCTDKYNNRAKWVPVYFKDEFWAGMSSTQRSEGMNNFFKGFVNVNTTLQVFVHQYTFALAKRMEDEERQSHDSVHKPYACLTQYGFELVFRELYTNSKFREFQKHVSDMMYCNATVIQENFDGVVYEVKTTKVRQGRTRRRTFLVSVQHQPLWDIKCECKNFEFRGILCSHILQVFKVEEKEQVPQRFIVDRWRKDLCREHTKESCGYGDLLKSIPKTRYDQMELKFQKLAARAMMNEEAFKKVMELMSNLELELKPPNDLPPGLGRDEAGNIVKLWGSRNSSVVDQAGGSNGAHETGPLDPKDARKRGRARAHRVGYAMDKKIEKKQRKKKVNTKKNAEPEIDLNL